MTNNQKIITCAFCQGTGKHPHFTGSCPVCKGRGKNQIRGKVTSCRDCRGSGQKGGTILTCFTCGGLGVVPDTREVIKKAREEIRKARGEMEKERKELRKKPSTSLAEEVEEDEPEDPNKFFCQSCAKSIKGDDLVKVCLECFGKIKQGSL
jgi:RecJ-like exonuclease